MFLGAESMAAGQPFIPFLHSFARRQNRRGASDFLYCMLVGIRILGPVNEDDLARKLIHNKEIYELLD
jgi:hypothetical protein